MRPFRRIVRQSLRRTPSCPCQAVPICRDFDSRPTTDSRRPRRRIVRSRPFARRDTIFDRLRGPNSQGTHARSQYIPNIPPFSFFSSASRLRSTLRSSNADFDRFDAAIRRVSPSLVDSGVRRLRHGSDSWRWRFVRRSIFGARNQRGKRASQKRALGARIACARDVAHVLCLSVWRMLQTENKPF